MQLYLHVKPNQRFNKVERFGEEWRIRLRAPAVDGKANEALVDFLSEVLEVTRTRITLRKGHTARLKCLDIDAEESEVMAKLLKAL
jgi:uncharacterized protein (TIGR00251 family)